MGLDQWIVRKLAQVWHWRYAETLSHEGVKWARDSEQRRLERLKAQLGAVGEDVILRNGVQIVVPQNVRLGHHVAVGYNSILHGNGGIILEDFTLLGDNCILATSSHPVEALHFHNTWEQPITIKQNAWLGANVIVLPGVTIGENSVIGAGAVVVKDIPPNSVAVGVPTRIVKTFELDPATLQADKLAMRARRLARIGSDSAIEAIFQD